MAHYRASYRRIHPHLFTLLSTSASLFLILIIRASTLTCVLVVIQVKVFSKHLDIGVLDIQVLESDTQVDVLRGRFVVILNFQLFY